MMNHGHQNTSGGFPLRSDFFRSLPLAKFKNDKLYRLAKSNALACLSQSFNDQWRYVPPEKDGTQIRKDTSNMAASYRLVRAATVLRCQEHEVNQVIANTNSESWREFTRKCFGKYYVDTLILHNVIKPNEEEAETSTNSSTEVSQNNSEDNQRAARSASQPEGSGTGEGNGNNEVPGENDERRGSLWQKGGVDRNSETNSVDMFPGKPASECSSANTEERLKEEAAAAVDGLGEQAEELLTVKWAAFETGISGKRDLCLVDYLSLAYIPNSEPRERVHVWCFTSGEGERVGCMELKDTHHVTRTTLTKLGVFWRKISEEETEVIVCGSFPSKHAPMVSSILLGCLNRLQGIVEDLRMSSQLYIQRATWVKNTERITCNLCTRNFHALRRKHHCRRCGEVVCSDCSTVETVDLPAIGYSKLRLCKVCSIRARTTPLKQVAKTNVFDHLDVTAVVRPMSTCLSTPTEDYEDDFIDERCLKTQLRAMEQKKRSIGSNSNMFDLLCELACQTLNCPIASVSIVDENGNYIHSSAGLEGNAPLVGELSVFIDKIMGSTPAIVLDANIDKQALQFFSLRSPPVIRFFAGCPIYSRTGKKLGYICVADFSKRDTLGASCAFTMERLATLAVTTMERNASMNNNNGGGNANTNNQDAELSKRPPPPTPTHPAMLFDRHNSNNTTVRGGRNGIDSRDHPEALVGRVYEILEDEGMPPMNSPATVKLNSSANASRPVTGERTPGYYEAQERMRKLLLKSYHTQQQLASGGSPQ
ncbi:hypothetical protein BBO99_00005454 [Phytophthora kernoviae]|uniref:FYVE-type domain-containing protein n=2 Tax=Phytophthora kernoviae TaxID=325452 RepID=A0A3R7NFG7_9STRA|nr:hypothetical protein G195_008488 [Phytophthora kernoviae 00238/432]KAG2520015.1 hypothetical protein JM18_007364 [Phytophthora kernoviae]RLN31481.1 hypothetical protein BBI17_005799 [Phytophthora kernoviae]RLN79183.1 hypothetical protein BBO99_00005454 [Phytophthora kernoviae]